jgi:hypothetical protein
VETESGLYSARSAIDSGVYPKVLNLRRALCMLMQKAAVTLNTCRVVRNFGRTVNKKCSVLLLRTRYTAAKSGK